MGNVNLTLSTGGGAPRISVAGEIDVSTVDHLAAAIDTAVRAATGTVVVDLADTTHIDSSGIRTLIAGRKLARERRVHYTVTGITGAVRGIFEASGVTSYLTAGHP